MPMNREIKFRAWDKENKKWAELPLLEVATGTLFEDGRAVEDNHVYRPDAFVLLQFTGLNDKNGKEIYEGDFLRHVHPDLPWAKQGQLLTLVEWKVSGWIAKYLDGIGEVKNYGDWVLSAQSIHSEVIGNIYENPELLKTN
jgi:uncharacterized phage protein (TIGR01671 family)